MNTTFANRIKSCTAARESREEHTDFILDHPDNLSHLVLYAFNSADKNSHKACWILELVAQQRLECLEPYLDFIFSSLGKLTHESSIRPLAKVCQILVEGHFKNTHNEINLSELQLQKVTESCFDWLIGETKVASKVYSIRTLFLLGQHFDWIHPELKTILEKETHEHSPAYKVASREILKKLR